MHIIVHAHIVHAQSVSPFHLFMGLILVLHSFNRKRFNIMSFIPLTLNEAYYFEFDAHFREQTREGTSETGLFTHYVPKNVGVKCRFILGLFKRLLNILYSILFNSHYN